VRDGLIAGKAVHASKTVDRLMRQVAAFDLHLAALDLRQHSERHTAALADLTRSFALERDYLQMTEAERIEWLTTELASPRPLVSPDAYFSEETTETLNVFRVARRAADEISQQAIGTYIISMTRNTSDVLAALVLAKQAGLVECGVRSVESGVSGIRTPHSTLRISVAPLFETIDDLRRSSRHDARAFFKSRLPGMIRQLAKFRNVMIGYSDSSKDGGILTSELGTLQSTGGVMEVAREFGVELKLFSWARRKRLVEGGGPSHEQSSRNQQVRWRVGSRSPSRVRWSHRNTACPRLRREASS
jgi:phosphoenolpyruvate carboxylase